MTKEYQTTFEKLTDKVGDKYKSYLLICEDKDNKTICMGGAGSTFDNLKFFLTFTTQILKQSKKEGKSFLKNTETLLDIILEMAKTNADNDIDNTDIGLSLFGVIGKMIMSDDFKFDLDDDDDEEDDD